MEPENYNPFSPRRGRGQAESPYDESAVMTSGARGLVGDFQRADAAAAKMDPLKERQSVLTQRKTQIGYARQAAEQLRDKFLATEGADLFEKDPTTGKLMDDPLNPGKPLPRMEREIEALRSKSQEKVGLIRGALTTAVAGELTADAKAAAARLTEREPLYKAQKDKWDRIQEQLDRIKIADDETELELGQIATARLNRDGVDLLGAPNLQQGSSVVERQAHNPVVAGSNPAPAPTALPTPMPAAGTPVAPTATQPGQAMPAAPLAPVVQITPAQLVVMHRRLKDAEAVMGMETTAPAMKEALRQKIERINDLLGKGMAALPTDQLRQRVIEHTGPLAGYESLNGGKTVQTAKAVARGATSEGIFAGGEGLANLARNVVTKSVPEVINWLEELRDMRSGMSPQDVASRKEERAKKYAGRSADLETDSKVVSGLKNYADTTKLIRENIRTALEVDQDFAQSLQGQVAQGAGQMVGTVASGVAGGPAAVAGMSVGQIYDEAFQDAKASGADDNAAHSAAMKYLPAAGLDFLSDQLIVGKLLKPLKGKVKVGDVLKDVLVSGAAEGITEGAQQAYLNQVAKRLEGYDPDREFDQEVYDSVLVGAIVGGGVTGVGAGVKKLVEPKDQPPAAGTAAKPGQPTAPLPDGVKAADTKVYPTAEAAEKGDEGEAPKPTLRFTFEDKAGQKVTIEGTGLKDARSKLPKEFKPDMKKTRQEEAPKPDAPAEFLGIEGEGSPKAFESYRLTADIPGHVKGSSVSRKTLEEAGFNVPARPGAATPETLAGATGGISEISKAGAAIAENMRQSFRDSVEKTGRLPAVEKGQLIDQIFERAVAQGEPRTVATLDRAMKVGDAAKWDAKTAADAFDKEFNPSQPVTPEPGSSQQPDAGASGTKPQAMAPAGKPSALPGTDSGAGSAPNTGSGREAAPPRAPLSLVEKRAAEVYRRIRAQNPKATDKTWIEQADEQSQNPSRFHKVVEDENPKGLRIGDTVTTTDKKTGEKLTGIVVTVEKTNATAYSGGYQVKVALPNEGEYGGFHGIDDVEKTGGGFPLSRAKMSPPAVARGKNTPVAFTKAVTAAAKIKPTDKAGKFLADFSKRLHSAAPTHFADMQVHVLTQAQWDNHPELGQRTPDSAGAYDQNTNTLFINADKSNGENIANVIVHEAGHFAEKFYLGEEFTQKEWEKLTPAQREAAVLQYAPRPNRPISEQKFDKSDKRARSEWVAMQFARVVRGDTEGMSTGLKAKLEKFLRDVRELVNRWIGDGKLTTKALDAKILEMLGYTEPKPDKHRLVGKNSAGQNVYEDDRGARHVEQVPNILVSEPVGLVPTRGANGGIQYLPEVRTAEQRKGTPFETVEESQTSARPSGETVTASSGKTPAAPAPQISLGKEAKMMGMPGIVVGIEEVDGIEHLLLRGTKANKGVVRVADKDSGNVISLTEYPSYADALAAFNDKIAKAKAVQQPAPEEKGKKIDLKRLEMVRDRASNNEVKRNLTEAIAEIRNNGFSQDVGWSLLFASQNIYSQQPALSEVITDILDQAGWKPDKQAPAQQQAPASPDLDDEIRQAFDGLLGAPSESDNRMSFLKYVRNMTFKDEPEARDGLRRLIRRWNTPTPGFPNNSTLDESFADQIKLVREGKALRVSQSGFSSRPEIELSANPIGNAPRVSWGAPDTQDYRQAARQDEEVIEAYMPIDQLPNPKLAGGVTGYSWDELNGRGTPPPPTIRLNQNKTVSIIDGNHRIYFWKQQGDYESIPAYVIRKKSNILGTPADNAQQGIPSDRRPAFLNLAEKMLAAGITTPEAMAAKLDTVLEKKARKFSQSLWNAFGVVRPELSSQPDWNAIYGNIDGQAVQPPAPANIAELITSDETRQQKSVKIAKMAKDRGISLKEAQELVEAELVRMVHSIALLPIAGQEKFSKALSIYEKQPLFSARTSTSVENQAYSTPAPLAIALRHMTGVNSGTPMYEPTAGTGMLMVGTDLSKSHANEINDVRRAALEKLGVATITDKDATGYVPRKKFSVVHANPPFGTIDNVNYDGFGIRKLEHLISLKALEAMDDNGAGALILGANLQPGKTSKGAQWVFENYLYSRYNVVDNFEVSGDLYANQGASWPVRVLVVAGRRATPLTGDLAPIEVDRLNTWSEVWSRANAARNEVERVRNRPRPEGQPGPTASDEQGAQTPAQPRNVSPQVGGSTEPARSGSQSRGNRGRKSAPAGEPARGGADVAPAGPSGQPGDTAGSVQQPSIPGEPTPRMEGDGQGGDVGQSGTDSATGSTADGRGTEPRVLPESVPVNDRQSTYVPRSEGTPFGTLTPTAVASKELAALDKLVKKVGPLADFVADRINMPVEKLKEVLAADQIDGVAQAINQIETGGALVIGDETGIGKGRQAAAVIRYAIVQGKIPVFFTKDPKLFSDMYADLRDIGTTVKPLIFGDQLKATIKASDDTVIVKAPNSKQQKALIEKVTEDGMEKAGFDVIFSTYSQINERNERQHFLENLATKNDVVVILDEAHEASGDGDSSMQAAFMRGGEIERGKGSNKTKIPVPGLLNKSGTKKGRGGVLYLSATYAKRPDNMPLYFRTAMSKASKGFAELVQAMEKGGVALQQAVSEALAAGGQYLRRERDFSGVNYTQREVGTERAAELRQQVDEVTSVLRQIVDFSKAAKDLVGEAAGGKGTAMSEGQIDVTEFAAVVHNNVSQLLLSAKADETVQLAIQLHRNGEKPVITLMNTMESFLDHFVTDKDIKPGERMNLTWKDLLKHALSRTLRASIKQPNGDTEIVTVTPEEIGMESQYEAIVEAIDELDVPFPVSPIDYIVQQLRDAGIKIGELTGRTSGIEYTNPRAGEGTYKHFPKADKNTLVNGFNSGELDALLINASGSTGLSIHASTKFKDKKKRHMIIAQPALDINVFVQTLGRIKRTGMVPGSAEYTHLKLPLQAEIRPAVITNRKMRSLNANTSAEAEGGVKIDSADILNKYGDEVVTEYLDGDIDLQGRLGLHVEANESNGQLHVKPDMAKKFTGRISLLPDAEQERIYSEIIPTYNNYIEQLRQTGEYDLDIVVHDDWDGVLGADEQLQAGTDESSIFTASVRAQQWEITDNRPIPTGQDMLNELARNHGSREQFIDQWNEFRGKVNTQVQTDLEAAKRALFEAESMADGKDKEAAMRRASKDENHANKMKTRWEGIEAVLDRVFDKFGQPIEIEAKSEKAQQSWSGMLVGVVFPKPEPSGRVRFAASRFQLKFMVDEPGGRHFLTGASFMNGSMELVRTALRPQDFQGGRGRDTRYKRWVITGNPIAAYSATGGQGKMVRFKSREGEIVTGLLMRQNWSIDKLPSDPRYKLVSGEAVRRFLDGQRSGGYRMGAYTGSVGMVRIQPQRGYYSSGYEVQVPASSKGKDYYLDPQLRDILGDFKKVGSRMVADVRSDQIAKVADRLAKIAQQDFRADGNGPMVLKLVSESNKPAQPLGTPAEPALASASELIPFGSDPGWKAAMEQYANKGRGFDQRTGTTRGLSRVLDRDAGARLWEDMSEAERIADFRRAAISDYRVAIQEASNPTDYLLDRALDPLDPMGGFYKMVLKRAGAEIDGNRIRVRPEVRALIDGRSQQGQILGTPPVTGTPEQERILNKVTGTLEDKRTFTQKIGDYLADLGGFIAHELQQKVLDRFAAVKRLERETIGTNEIDASTSAYKWSRLTHNLPGVMEYLLKHGQIAYRNGSMEMVPETKGLIDILKPVVDSGKLRLWEGYVAAFRANRLLAEGKEKNFGKFLNQQTGEWDWDAGRAQEEINALLELGKDHPEFEQVRQDYVTFQKSVLDMATAAGLIDPAKRAMWERSDYVPFYRIVEALDNPKDAKGPAKRRGFSGQSAGIRQLKGGPQQVAILENIFRNIEQMVDASFKNIAMQRIADLAGDNTDLLVKIPYKAVPFKATAAETVQRLEEAGVDVDSLSEQELNEVVTFWRMRAPEGKDIVSVMNQGKPVYYRVKDRPLLRSILALGPDRHALWMRMLMAPRKALTTLVTLDPAFMAANTIRDSFSAWVISDSPIKPGWDSMRGFVKSLKDDPVKLSIMVNGGGTGHYNNMRESEVRRAFLRMTREQQDGFKASIIDTPAKLFRVYRDIGRATENANRIAIAESAANRGASPAEAAFQALDIMDFGLRGDSALIGFFLDTVPFLNARIQGLYRLGRGIINDPKRVATHGAIIMGASLALLAANWEDERYWDLPEWDRDLYYHFWVGDRHIRIPKPFEVGQIFSTIPERFAQVIAKDGDGRTFGRRMLNILDQTFLQGSFYGVPVPQVVKPMLDVKMNQSSLTGGRIISAGDAFKKPEDQYNAFTSETVRELAKAAPDIAPEWMKSPKQLEYLIRGYFGTLGTYAMDASDAIVRQAANYPEKPASKFGDYWVTKRFSPESDLRDSKFVSEFYELHQDIGEVMAKVKSLREAGDTADANEIVQENRDMIAYAPVAQSTAKALSAIRRRERDLYANPRSMTPEQRRDELARLAAQRNALTKRTVQQAPGRPEPFYNPFRR